MDIALDIIVAAIIIFTIWRASVKGLIRTVFDMLKFIVSSIVATVFKGVVAQFIMGTGLYKNASEAACDKLSEAIIDAGKSVGSSDMLDVFRSNNPELVNIIESMGGDIEKTKRVVEQAAISGSEDLALVAADHILEPALTSVAYILAFMFLFIIAYVALSIVEYALNAMFELPLLHSVNKAGGIAVGVICAVLYTSLFVSLTSPFISNPDMVGGDWDKEIADKTLIYSYIDDHNILSIFMHE